MKNKETLTVKEALKTAVVMLKENNVSEPESSAEVLLFNVLEKNRAYLYSHGEDRLTNEQEKLFLEFIERRKSHEPVWYILGEVEFYGRKFKINNNVLTPRPETEILVQEVLKSVASSQAPVASILELGTGAGGIIISLAKELESYSSSEEKRSREASRIGSPQGRAIKFIATDISPEALDVAKDNAKRLGADIEFFEGDLLTPVLATVDWLLPTVLVANLPYIPEEDMTSLQFDVLHHEPRVALSGGKGGIEIYERLMHQLKEIDFKGLAFFEIGIEQGDLLKPIVNKIFPEAKVKVIGDMANIDRIVRIDF